MFVCGFGVGFCVFFGRVGLGFVAFCWVALISVFLLSGFGIDFHSFLFEDLALVSLLCVGWHCALSFFVDLVDCCVCFVDLAWISLLLVGWH